MQQHIAIYTRVSSTKQTTENQKLDLQRYIDYYTDGETIIWYDDTSNDHKKMDRVGWNQLEQDMKDGKVKRLVVWKIDRLGRRAAKLHELWDNMKKWGVEFHSVKEGLTSGTAVFDLVAGILASIAQFELETMSERIKAGIARSKQQGKKRKSRKGQHVKVTPKMMEKIEDMKAKGFRTGKIAKATGMSDRHVRRIVAKITKGEDVEKTCRRKVKHTKLDPNDIAVFKNLYKAGTSVTQIARELGISRQQVYRLIPIYFTDEGTEKPVIISGRETQDEVIEEIRNHDFGVNLSDYEAGI